MPLHQPVRVALDVAVVSSQIALVDRAFCEQHLVVVLGWCEGGELGFQLLALGSLRIGRLALGNIGQGHGRCRDLGHVHQPLPFVGVSLPVRDHHAVLLDLVRRQFRLRRTSPAVNQRQQLSPPLGEPGNSHGVSRPAVLTLGTH